MEIVAIKTTIANEVIFFIGYNLEMNTLRFLKTTMISYKDNAISRHPGKKVSILIDVKNLNSF